MKVATRLVIPARGTLSVEHAAAVECCRKSDDGTDLLRQAAFRLAGGGGVRRT